jgi:hypothetical protein
VKQPFIEEILMEHLRPVSAPASLRLSAPEYPVKMARKIEQNPGVSARLVWRTAFATVVVLLGSMALLELRSTANHLEYPCESASQLQAWMKDQGVDVPLPATLPNSVQLMGGNRAPGGAVEVVYRVQGLTQKLRVSNVAASGTGHHFEDGNSKKGAWVMGSHLYQLESGDASLACKLCHSGA